jgi:undecaprenyl diphosphate synthase
MPVDNAGEAPVTATGSVPHHVAVIMDGNGRWAQRRGLPRPAGHQAGAEAVRRVVEESVRAGVRVLTLFAFSSENWRRPRHEVALLMDLFFRALKRELPRLKANGVRLRIIGDRAAFSDRLQRRMADAEAATAGGDRLVLQVAANYGGRWDITQAARALARAVKAGELEPDAIDETRLGGALSFPDAGDPDLLIRTGGEQRLSNFLLWQSAYTELYFTDTLWPDFDAPAYSRVLQAFGARQRRFGQTAEQVQQEVAGG